MPTLVFDEIDTGVGGRLGATLGKTLAGLARHHQIICVTHLPQMASYAHAQWVIRQHVEKGRTRTTITPLGDTDRVDEIAAMLRGDSAAESTRREARDAPRSEGRALTAHPPGSARAHQRATRATPRRTAQWSKLPASIMPAQAYSPGMNSTATSSAWSSFGAATRRALR